MQRPNNNDASRETSANRLFQAAEATLLAASQIASSPAGRYVPPAQLMDADDAPACLSPFTREEIEDATAFLERMGYLPSSAGADR